MQIFDINPTRDSLRIRSLASKGFNVGPSYIILICSHKKIMYRCCYSNIDPFFVISPYLKQLGRIGTIV